MTGTVGQPGIEEPTRERVRSTIGLVGGYWRPLAAVARLLEELGELAELERSDPRYASELADLWIITTALSDQFLGAVAEPGSGDSASPAPVGNGGVACDLLADLLATAGPIARIVNYYDGPKTPRSFDGWISLNNAIAWFHRSLADVAHACGVDLAKVVHAKLDAIPTVDSSRFASGRHDPSTAASLERFRALQATSAQLDASQADAAGAGHDMAPADFDLKRARLWGSPDWSSDDPASNIRALVADLTSFTKAAPWERLDAYLICGPPCSSIALRQDWLRCVLSDVSTLDPSGGKQVVTELLEGAESPFAFNGMQLLVSTFDVPPATAPLALLRVERAADGLLAQ